MKAGFLPKGGAPPFQPCLAQPVVGESPRWKRGIRFRLASLAGEPSLEPLFGNGPLAVGAVEEVAGREGHPGRFRGIRPQ